MKWADSKLPLNKTIVNKILIFFFYFVALTEFKATASFVSQIAWFHLFYPPFGCDHGNIIFIFQLFDLDNSMYNFLISDQIKLHHMVASYSSDWLSLFAIETVSSSNY